MTPGYEADMRRIIGRETAVRVHARGVIVTLLCKGCGPVEYPMEKMLPPDAVKRQLANRGWTLGKRPQCPDCRQKDKPSMGSETAMAVVQTAAAKQQFRSVFEALQIAYDEDAKAYSKGYTDAKVAEETGAPVAFVTKTREDYFGPIAEPSELGEIRRDLDALTASIASTRQDMALIQRNNGQACDDLAKTAKAIRDKLDAMALKNGWKS